MLPQSRQGRQAAGAAAVVVLSVAASFAARGLHGDESASPPPYRELGPASARVTIVEYSDFQCPACRAAEEPLKGLLKLYGADVRLVFKHFPLEGLHPWARPAASAAECAGRQGKFWPFHDLLYSRQGEWVQAKDPPAALAGYARELRLDLPAFRSCLDAPEVKREVDADMAEGTRRWVGSTPTFFINGRRFAGALQLSARGTPWIEKNLKR